MFKVLNIFFLILIIFFSLTVYKYYSSITHLESRDFNRNNIDQIINLIKNDGVKIKDIKTDDGDLEDIFLRAVILSLPIKPAPTMRIFILFS